MGHMKKSWGKTIKTILGVLVGNLVLSFAVAAFTVPNGIIMGGATGIGLTISHYFPVNLSLIILAINAVLFVLGAVFLGKKFALTTIISSFIYPIFLSMAQSIPGIGLVVRVGASTGGTDILALVLHKWFHVPVAVFLYIVDFSVLGLQMLFSDSEQILYGILNLFLSTVVLNRVMLLGKSQIQLFIISDKYREIRQKVLTDIDAGVTMVDIETGYGEQKQQGVLCVIHSRKLYSVKEAIQEIDPKAFITITQINEVRGRGFTMEKRISGHTGLLALIGSPVGHSGSPAMYNYSFEKLGLDYAYVAFDIKEDKVKDAIAAMKTFNMRGCNVTMPDKVEAA